MVRNVRALVKRHQGIHKQWGCNTFDNRKNPLPVYCTMNPRQTKPQLDHHMNTLNRPKYSDIGTAAIKSHQRHTYTSDVILRDGRRVQIPIDSSDTRDGWYWSQVTHGVERFLAGKEQLSREQCYNRLANSPSYTHHGDGLFDLSLEDLRAEVDRCAARDRAAAEAA